MSAQLTSLDSSEEGGLLLAGLCAVCGASSWRCLSQLQMKSTAAKLRVVLYRRHIWLA